MALLFIPFSVHWDESFEFEIFVNEEARCTDRRSAANRAVLSTEHYSISNEALQICYECDHLSLFYF